MNALWDVEQGSVADVMSAMSSPRPARSTVMTTLTILERKGFVKHTERERTYIFSPVVDRDTAGRNAVRALVSRFFGNSVRALVQSIVDDRALSEKELHEIQRVMAKSQAQRRRPK